MDYKLVKYCRWCKKRFVVDRAKARMIYCTECQRKILKEKNKDEKS